MYITRIDVTALQHTASASIGLVALSTVNDTIQMHCAVHGDDPEGVEKALIADALRQLSRMPEFRTGHRKLLLAPGLGQAEPAAA